MYKLVFIGGINRSGGSLLARLFDGHKNFASYPLELPFPHDNSFYNIFENYSGIPMTVPSNYDGNINSINRNLYGGNESRSPLPDLKIQNNQIEKNILNLLDITETRPKVPLKWGTEKSDPVGVRKNYLEKAFYDNIRTNFDFDKFLQLFHSFSMTAGTCAEVYDARHKAYFSSWDDGQIAKRATHVVMHDSGGLYLTNIDSFFTTFPDSFFVFPVRDVMGYVASEKTRLARRYFGTRRFAKPTLPNYFIRKFKYYDLDAKIRAWMSSITRGYLLQEKFGVASSFLVYSNECLLNHPEKTMKSFCDIMKIEYDPILIKPTIKGKPWRGNSHQGPSKGINKQLANYYPKVLSKNEIERIQSATDGIRDFLLKNTKTPINLTEMKESLLFDYNYQKKYFHDKDKTVLYSALINSGGRRALIGPQGISSIVAYFMSKFVRIYHIPRLLKFRFFPGLGKQNYT